MIARFAGLAAAAVLAGGCGSGRSTPSSASAVPTAAPTPPPVPVFRDGGDGQPVGAEATPALPTVGSPITVRASGYLVREQRFDGSPIFLWPAPDEGYVRELAYWEFRDGSLRTVRWSRGFTVTLEGDLADEPAIVDKTREVIEEMRRVSGLAIDLGPGGACVVGLDPSLADENVAAEARLTFTGAAITGASVVFVNRREITGGARSNYRNTLLHEMGHVLGLIHSTNDRDVMTPAAGPGTREPRFQPGEELCYRMIYNHRSAGNIFPDRDPALGAAAVAGPVTTEIVD